MLKREKKLKISKTSFNVIFAREVDKRWIAEMPALPCIMAYGTTKKEALQRVYAIALRTLADNVEEGKLLAPISYFFEYGVARS